MIGYYNYTVILTYLSLLSAGSGIVISLSGKGHPYLGIFFLLFSGLCDAFDGKVARTKKNRTEMEKNYGIQIDSLSDIVAFGVLPACIGAALIRVSPFFQNLKANYSFAVIIEGVFIAILLLYVLAALIRLAYFNVTEEERQKSEGGVRKTYTGLPVTSASLIFPTIMLIQFITPIDMTLLYFFGITLTGFLFLSKFQIKKPGLKEILVMVAIGSIEFIILLVLLLLCR